MFFQLARTSKSTFQERFIAASRRLSRPPLILTLALFFFVFGFLQIGRADGHVNALGKATIERITNLFLEWQDTKVKKPVFKEAAQLIDYQEMSEKALGSYWGKLTDSHKQEFVSTLKCLIQEKYYKRWRKMVKKGELKYLSEARSGESLLVKTSLRVGKKEDCLLWRLSRRTGEYRVISIAVNQKDLLERLSARLKRHLREDSLEDLLAWMKDEAEIEDNELEGKT